MKNNSLMAQMRAAFLVLPILLIAVITLYFGFKLIKDQNELKEGVANRSAQNILEKIDRNFYERYGDVQAFAFNTLAVQAAEKKTSTEETQRFINTMISYYVLYDLMMILDLDGNVIACNTIDKDGNTLSTAHLLSQNFKDSRWFLAAQRIPIGQAYYGDFEENLDVSKLFHRKGFGVSFAAPIRNMQGQIVGVWYNFSNWKEITESIRNEVLTNLKEKFPSSEIIMTNSNNTIIDSPDQQLTLTSLERALTKEKFDLPVLKDKTHLRSSTYLMSYSKSKGAYTYKGNQWICYTFIPITSISFSSFISVPILIIDILFLLVSFLVSQLFSAKIKSRIHKIIYSIEKLASGEVADLKITTTKNDEFGRIENCINQLCENLEKNALFAREVGNSNFSLAHQPISDRDILGNALVQMRDNLFRDNLEEKRRNWTAEVLEKFSNIFRNEKTLGGLGDQLLKELSKCLGTTVSALYAVRNDSTGTTLEMISCYGYNRKKYLSSTLLPGEGLVGQAFLEKEKILLTEIPPSYHKITSGLGEALPKCISIIPLVLNDKVLGVLEISSFNMFETHELQLLTSLSENIASALFSIESIESTQKLLEDSRQKTEELQSQEEEMRQNMEELSATQEEMIRKENTYLKIIAELKEKMGDHTFDNKNQSLSDPLDID